MAKRWVPNSIGILPLLEKKSPELSLFVMCGQKVVDIYKPGRALSTGTKVVSTEHVLGLQVSRELWEINFWFLSHLVCGKLLWQPEQFNTTIHSFRQLMPLTIHNPLKFMHFFFPRVYHVFSSWRSPMNILMVM